MLKILDDAWLGILVDEKDLFNPLQSILHEFEDEAHLALSYLMMQPQFFSLFVKEIMNVQLLPTQMVLLKESWHRKFPMWIASRGFSKSFMEGVYCLLRAVLIPNRNIIICGSVFRQSKIVFEYIEKIYKNAPRLQQICDRGSEKTLAKDTDVWRMRIGNSTIMSVPVGNTGEGVRGLRANDLIAEEFAAHNRDIFEVILSGFTAVSADPVEKIKQQAKKELAEKLGIELEEVDNPFIPTNQLLIAGTAYYQFNHFYEYWRKWKTIIETGGDKEKIRNIFGDSALNQSLNPKDYIIFRIPYELVPKGFMDESQIARSRASMHIGNFSCEFGACEVNPNTLISTSYGYKKLSEIEIGDKILSHAGFSKITAKTTRNYEGWIYKIITQGSNIPIEVTCDHEFMQGQFFCPIKRDTQYLEITRLTKLNNLKSIDLADYVKSASIESDIIYTKSNNRKGLNNILNRHIKCDYNLGLILGYYAADGSSARYQTYFDLNISEENYIKQLEKALSEVFGVKARRFYRGNLVRLIINSKIFVEFIKKICPGNSSNKFIDPNILYSNAFLIKGFIEGLYNGDGTLTINNNAYLKLCSLSLLCQFRICLSYFGIYGSLSLDRSESTSIICGNKCKLQPIYLCTITGKYSEQFFDLISYPKIRKQHNRIICKNDRFLIPIKKIEKIWFNGPVYNLEVKDHSYTTINYTCHNCFQNDSAGFFKRSLIESCVAHEKNNLRDSKGPIVFYPTLRGSQTGRYVMAIDPASEHDNFAITIIELHPDHRRIVYCWTITRREQKERIKEGLITENDFYKYCTMKIRELMRNFNIERIAIDSQGGRPISEALSSNGDLSLKELPIYEIIDPTEYKDTDSMQGLHIIEMINFADAKWVSDANHGLRKDFEDKLLLFPHFDPLSIGFAGYADKDNKRMFDTLEDCVTEIEELKDELSTIVMTTTGVSGRERWDTPDKIATTGKKTKMRKDRYSALLMANASAKLITKTIESLSVSTIGGFTFEGVKGDLGGPSYIGPQDLCHELAKLYSGV